MPDTHGLPTGPPVPPQSDEMARLIAEMETEAASTDALPAPVRPPAAARVAPPVPGPGVQIPSVVRTPAPGTVIPATPVAPPAAGRDSIEVDERERKFDLDAALRSMVEAGGSDLHVTVSAPPTMRLHGSMTPVPGTDVLTGQMIRDAVYGILTSRQQKIFEEKFELDLAHTIPGVSRFRVNLFNSKTEPGAVFRAIPWEIKSLDSLGMPQIVTDFAHYERGLVLVTGPTGSGKSTTLASIIDEANRTRASHIMTVEDPIEFIHGHKRSIINQREVGADTHTFADALKHVLRQDPDIILIGELRDLETISVALTAAETGHLVFGTLHTQSAKETVSRIVDVFPAGQQNQIQTQLAATLQAVLCQTLVETRDKKGRAAAAEIMVCDDAIRNQIRKGNLHQIESTLQTSKDVGMQTMVKHLAQLAVSGRISFQAGWEKAPNRDEYIELTGGEAAVTRALNSGAIVNDRRGSM